MCVPLPTVHKAAFSVPYSTSNNLDLLGYICRYGQNVQQGMLFIVVVVSSNNKVLISTTMSNLWSDYEKINCG